MPPILQINNATVRFGGLTAVDNASLTIQPGELIGFVGPNGAGKTTLMRVIMGIITPQEGAVILEGEDLVKRSINQRIRAGLALAQQIVQPLRKMTLLEGASINQDFFVTGFCSSAIAPALLCVSYIHVTIQNRHTTAMEGGSADYAGAIICQSCT